ncbi:MAG: IS66 family transposase [Candidatus Wenzhouxiangella sp. M2_3B_020]
MAIDLQNEQDIERLRQVAVLQDAEIALLHERIGALSAEIDEIREQKQGQLQRELEAVKQHLQKLQKMQFGASTEKRERDEERAPKQRRRRRKSGPTPQPDLPRVEAVFELDEADKICPDCGDPLDEMGRCFEESEMIDVVERQFIVKQVRRQKYRCRCGHIESALGPDKLRGTRRYSPEFAIEVATNKYLDHLPLERQSRRMGRQGLNVSSQTLWDQIERLADHLETTYLGIRRWIFGGDVAGMDETVWPMLEKGRKTWQLWSVRGRGAVWFALRGSRSGETAAELLDDYSGWLVCDGLKSYDKAARQSSGTIRLAGCWAHIRRKFIDAEPNHPEKCDEILELIAQLYEIEARARDPDEDVALLEWRAKLREEESKPKLAEIKRWADSQAVLPRSALGKAIRHMRSMWPRLVHFADHPELWIDNNPTERAIRGPVVGRKNHYGSRSVRGTEVAAIIYTIVETAKACGVDPRAYMRRVVENDIRNPYTVTLPHPIEEVMASVE